MLTHCILKRWQQILNGSSKSYPGTQSSCLYLGLTPHPLERMRPVKERRQKPHSQVGKAEPNGSRKLLSGNGFQIIKYTYPPPRLKPLQGRASRPGRPRTRSQSRPSLPTALHPRFHCLQDFVHPQCQECHSLPPPTILAPGALQVASLAPTPRSQGAAHTPSSTTLSSLR